MMMAKIDLFLSAVVGHIAEKLEEDNLEHHSWLICRSAEIWGIDILAKLVDEGEVNHFI